MYIIINIFPVLNILSVSIDGIYLILYFLFKQTRKKCYPLFFG